MLAGVLVGAYVGHVRRGIPLGPGLNAVAPSLPLAQAIGRWGNYFNQELFGRPTDLPWALEVDAETAQTAGYPPGTTFHPTFLYESLCNFALCGILIWIDKRFNPAGGRLLAMYVLGYGVIRFWVEGLRIDPADEIGPFRWNQWVALACIAGGGLYLIATRDKPKDILVPAGAGAVASEIAEEPDDAELIEIQTRRSRSAERPTTPTPTSRMPRSSTTRCGRARTPTPAPVDDAGAEPEASDGARADPGVRRAGRPRRRSGRDDARPDVATRRAGRGVEDVEAVGAGDQADPITGDARS